MSRRTLVGWIVLVGRTVFVAALFSIFVLGLAFAVENAHEVQFTFYNIGSVSKPLSLLLVYTLLLGGLLGVAASAIVVLQLKNQIRLLRRSEAVAREEVRNLRAIPIEDNP